MRMRIPKPSVRRALLIALASTGASAIVVLARLLYVHSPFTQYFIIDLAWRALHAFASSMGSTALGYAVRFLMVPAGVFLLQLARALAHRRMAAEFPPMTWKRWKSNLTDAAIIGVLVAAVFYIT
jgi:hypothetical protein